MILPKPTSRVDAGYLARLVTAIERELSDRARKIGGTVYVTREQPLVLQAPDGSLYQLSVANDGTLVTTAVTV